MYSRLVLFVALVLIAFSASVNAAIIANLTGKKVTTSGTATVTTNSKGQRQIAITIDPGVVTDFQLDVLYPSDVVTPLGYDGITPRLTDQAVQFAAPYGGSVGGGASILPPPGGLKTGLINDIQGHYQFPPGLAGNVPLANRPDGNSDLFTLIFIDNDPTVDKTFTVLGVDSKGVDPDFAPFIADNFLDVYIDDRTDPLDGQIIRITGDDIGAAQIFVPGISKDANVPLPLGVATGLFGGGHGGRKQSRTSHAPPRLLSHRLPAEPLLQPLLHDLSAQPLRTLHDHPHQRPQRRLLPGFVILQ
jgi:hypothetical protein